MQEIRAQEERENAESLGCELRPGSAEVRVSTNMAAPTNMLTDRELECITTVFRSVIGVQYTAPDRIFTILGRVSKKKVGNFP